MIIVHCQHCGNEMLRDNPNISGLTCFTCKKNRQKEWTEAHKANRNYNIRWKWICKCRRRNPKTEPICWECLDIRRNGKKVFLKPLLKKKLPPTIIDEMWVPKSPVYSCSHEGCALTTKGRDGEGYFIKGKYYCNQHAI